MSQLSPLDDQNFDEIARFVAHRLGDQMDEPMVREVMSELVRSPDHVVAVRRQGALDGVALVIDTCENSEDFAEASLFLRRPNRDDFQPLLRWARNISAKGPRQNFGVTLWNGCGVEAPWLGDEGLTPSFTLFTMEREKPWSPDESPSDLPANWSWQTFEMSRDRAYYDAMDESLRGTPGIFHSDYDDYLASIARREILPELLVDAEGQIAGFIQVREQEDGWGELALLGRVPRYRGEGLGPKIVRRGFELLHRRGVRRFRIGVAARNRSALKLYESVGFVKLYEVTTYLEVVKSGLG